VFKLYAIYPQLDFPLFLETSTSLYLSKDLFPASLIVLCRRVNPHQITETHRFRLSVLLNNGS